MAMDATRLGTKLWTDVKASQSFSPALTSAQDAAGLALWTTIAGDIISEITGHAAVIATGTDPQGGTVSSTGTVS